MGTPGAARDAGILARSGWGEPSWLVIVSLARFQRFVEPAPDGAFGNKRRFAVEGFHLNRSTYRFAAFLVRPLGDRCVGIGPLILHVDPRVESVPVGVGVPSGISEGGTVGSDANVAYLLPGRSPEFRFVAEMTHKKNLVDSAHDNLLDVRSTWAGAQSVPAQVVMTRQGG